MGKVYITQEDLRDIMWDLVGKMGSQKDAAKTLRMSESYFSEVLNGKAVSEDVANRLGFTVSKMYAPIEEENE